MLSPVTPAPTAAAASRRATLGAAAAIAVAGFLAYHNTFRAPLEFDDIPALLQNSTIRHLWPLWSILTPPLDLTVSGRPVLNFSFAVNYAISGTNVWSYHWVNLAIHLLAGVTLFGIVRRTLVKVGTGVPPVRADSRDVRSERTGGDARPYLFALAVALLWTVHPLQTESVTYVVQRAESLMGLFYLLTLYGFIRYAEGSGNVRRWGWLCFLSCLLGMGTKEVMVSAPVMILLYDRTFISGGFHEAWRRHGRIFLALAATWLLLAVLVFSTKERNGTAGFGIEIGWWQYLMTQAPAIVHYLKLSFWPLQQVFDYGAQWISWSPALVRDGLIVLLLLGGSVAALWRRPKLGFLGLWFFAILAPTSLVPGNRQTLAEHRMYLALIPVIVLAVAGVARLCAWALAQIDPPGGTEATDAVRLARERRGTWSPLLVCLALAAALAVLTERRNELYRVDILLWNDTVAKCPSNPYARNNLGNMLLQYGRVEAAIREYKFALQLKPDYAESRNNLGTALVKEGKIDLATQEFHQVLAQTGARLASGYGAEVHNNLGVALFESGDPQGAVAQFEEAIRLKARYPEGRMNFGNALSRLGRIDEAIAQYREALRLEPGFAEGHNNLANVLLASGQVAGAVTEYREAVRLRPAYVEARNNLGNALLQAGQAPEAIAEFTEALQLRPTYIPARFNLANALSAAGRMNEAIEQYGVTLRLKPDYAEAHNNLGNLLVRANKTDEAVAQFVTALALRPAYADAHNNLGSVLLNEHKVAEAKVQIQEALRLRPNYPEAHNNLGNALTAEAKPAEAAIQYAEALRLGLNIAEVHNNFGVALLRLGRRPEARAQFEAALRLKPGYDRAMRNLAETRVISAP